MIRLRNLLLASMMGCGIAVALISCDDDENGYAVSDDAIHIVSNDLIFPAEGTTAVVQVEVAGTLEATVDADWCTASVSGHMVTVTAEANYGFDGRTALLTLKSVQASRQLPVQQLGMVLDMPMVVSGHYSPREGEEFSLTIVHNVPMTATADQTWLHPVVDGNTLRVKVDSNVGGHIRRGQIVCACGEYIDTLRVAQFDLRDDVVGSYYMMGYYGGNGGMASATRFDIILRHDSLLMHWPQERYANAYVHIPIDRSTCTLFIPSGFTLYRDSRSVVSGYFYDANGTVATTSGAGAMARLFYVESTGYNSATLEAANWSGHTLSGFILRNSSIVTTTLIQLGSPVLIRVGPVGTELE